MRRTLVILTLLLLFSAGAAQAAGRVRLVVMDGVNLEHLADESLVNFRFLFEHGAVGLANANTAGGRIPEHSAATIGAGSRALGPGMGGVFLQDEQLELGTAGDIFSRRTGISPPPSALVVPSIAHVIDMNEELPYTLKVGYLATALSQGGKSIAALVADGEEHYRPAAAIAADGRGLVPGGLVGKELLTNMPLAPLGVQSDLAAFARALDSLASTDFVVMDLGDTWRAQMYGQLALEPVRNKYRQDALAQLDSLLGLLLERHQEGDLILVTALQASQELGSGEAKWLVPVLAYGNGFESGLLTSPTTRRQGVVASFDLTATILNHFGLYQGGIHGQPMTYLAQGRPLQYLLVREEEMARVYTLRTPLIKGFIGLIILMVGTATAALILKWRRLEVLKLLLAAVAASPLVLLLLGTIPGSVWMVPVWITLSFTIALAMRKLEPLFAMRLLGAVTASTVALDALLGAWLQQRSILGYDAIAGARYYGIGNEYMGVLVGSTLLALGGHLVNKKLGATIVFAGVILLLMLPGVGANFGGTLAATMGFTFALTGTAPLTNKKHRLLAVLAGAVVAGALVVFNLVGDQSHVGRFFAAVVADPTEFLLAVQRKLEMSWRLVRWSLWSRAFAVLFLATLWLIFTNRHMLAKRLGQHWPGVRGAMTAALAALVLNDSGIVAAATTLLYLTLPLLYYEFSSNSLVRDSHSA